MLDLLAEALAKGLRSLPHPDLRLPTCSFPIVNEHVLHSLHHAQFLFGGAHEPGLTNYTVGTVLQQWRVVFPVWSHEAESPEQPAHQLLLWPSPTLSPALPFPVPTQMLQSAWLLPILDPVGGEPLCSQRELPTAHCPLLRCVALQSSFLASSAWECVDPRVILVSSPVGTQSLHGRGLPKPSQDSELGLCYAFLSSVPPALALCPSHPLLTFCHPEDEAVLVAFLIHRSPHPASQSLL